MDTPCQDETARALIDEHRDRLVKAESEIGETKRAAFSNSELLGRIVPMVESLSKMEPDLQRLIKLSTAGVMVMIGTFATLVWAVVLQYLRHGGTPHP